MKKDCHGCDPQEHSHKKARPQYFLWSTTAIIIVAYLLFIFFEQQVAFSAEISRFSASVFELMNRMSWGIALGILFVGLLGKIPRDWISSILGKGGTFSGILRATAAGVLLDLCSHGILLVGMKLYERGASLGQTMAFLIASPWNSISLTLILWALVGFWWMLAFLLLSMVVAIISGFIFDKLVAAKKLPANPYKTELEDNFSLMKEVKTSLKKTKWHPKIVWVIFKEGIIGSKMILKWIFLGVILASLIRTFISPEHFQTLFGPSILGLGLTIVVATILEVCSEGSTPIAADILTQAKAPGNSFAFLMTGVSTDYTEILALKETTKHWKIAFALPLITFPQVLILAIILNSIGT